MLSFPVIVALHSRRPVFSIPLPLLNPVLRMLFQVPYAVTPVFAILTKTAGVWGYSSHFGKACAFAAPRTRISFKLFLFTFLRTLLHTTKFNSFLFKRLRTLCPKTPGVGVPLSFQVTHICYSGRPRMIASSLLLPLNATRKRKFTP